VWGCLSCRHSSAHMASTGGHWGGAAATIRGLSSVLPKVASRLAAVRRESKPIKAVPARTTANSGEAFALVFAMRTRESSADSIALRESSGGRSAICKSGLDVLQYPFAGSGGRLAGDSLRLDEMLQLQTQSPHGRPHCPGATKCTPVPPRPRAATCVEQIQQHRSEAHADQLRATINGCGMRSGARD
jgi:hypothetical protein